MGNWKNRDRNAGGDGRFVSKTGLLTFKVINALDSLALGEEYQKYYKPKHRQLRLAAEVISEGDQKKKLITWMYQLKMENDASIAAVLRHIEGIFNVTIEGDENEPLDMGPLVGRVFMAEPKEREFGDPDDPKKQIQLKWFDPDNPSADFGDFILDDAVRAENEPAVLVPGSNDTSDEYWGIIQEAAAKRKEREDKKSDGGGGDAAEADDDEPLPF